MKITVKTIDEYIEKLSDDRKAQIETLIKVIKENIPHGFEETMSYGKLGFIMNLPCKNMNSQRRNFLKLSAKFY